MELDDELVLLFREVAALEVGAEVVDPPEAAALAAAQEAGGLGQRAPATLAVRLDVRHEAVVLLLGPRALVGVRLLAARRPPHDGGVVVRSAGRAPNQSDAATLPAAFLVLPFGSRRRFSSPSSPLGCVAGGSGGWLLLLLLLRVRSRCEPRPKLGWVKVKRGWIL